MNFAVTADSVGMLAANACAALRLAEKRIDDPAVAAGLHDGYDFLNLVEQGERVADRSHYFSAEGLIANEVFSLVADVPPVAGENVVDQIAPMKELVTRIATAVSSGALESVPAEDLARLRAFFRTFVVNLPLVQELSSRIAEDLRTHDDEG